ncbi:MAG: helix-turn-helix domain containing protein [bacterium]|nr:helix-turn-helix domain containing protein [bacterium]
MDTKHRILEAALTLFSQKGYANVYVGEIADAVGIKAPSLYKHYKSKQAIFDAILEEMQLRYADETSLMHMDGQDANIDAQLFESITEDHLVELGTKLFLYFLHDSYVCRFRRMLTIEQFHDTGLAALYNKLYVNAPMEYQGMIFVALCAKGILQNDQIDIMTLHFYAPFYLLLTICDREPDREPEILEKLEQHIRQFNRLYGGRENEDRNA